MKLVKKGEGSPDQAPGHYGQAGITMLAAGKDTQRVSFIISHFVPGGGVNKGAAPGELIYYGLTGSLRVKSNNEEFVLGPGDTIYIPAGEEREFQAIGSDPTTILVAFSPNPK
jgi:quercetin dioxygenase-like cupin family protein